MITLFIDNTLYQMRNIIEINAKKATNASLLIANRYNSVTDYFSYYSSLRMWEIFL